MGIESLDGARRRSAAPVNAQIVPCRRTNSGRRRAVGRRRGVRSASFPAAWRAQRARRAAV